MTVDKYVLRTHLPMPASSGFHFEIGFVGRKLSAWARERSSDLGSKKCQTGFYFRKVFSTKLRSGPLTKCCPFLENWALVGSDTTHRKNCVFF